MVLESYWKCVWKDFREPLKFYQHGSGIIEDCWGVCVYRCNHSRRQLNTRQTVKDLNTLFIIHGLNSDKSIQLNICNFQKQKPLICYLVLIEDGH